MIRGMLLFMVVCSVLLLVRAQNSFDFETVNPFEAYDPKATMELVPGGVSGNALRVVGNMTGESSVSLNSAAFRNRAFSFWVKAGNQDRVDIYVHGNDMRFSFQYTFFNGTMGVWESGFSRFLLPFPYTVGRWYLLEAWYPKSDYSSQYMDYYINNIPFRSAETYRPFEGLTISLAPGADMAIDSVDIACPSGCNGYQCETNPIFRPCTCPSSNTTGLTCSPVKLATLTTANPTYSSSSPNGFYQKVSLDYEAFNVGFNLSITSDVPVQVKYEICTSSCYDYTLAPSTQSNISFERCVGNKKTINIMMYSPDLLPFTYSLTAKKILPAPLPNSKSVSIPSSGFGYFPLTGNGPFTVQYTLEFTGDYASLGYGTKPCNLTNQWFNKDGSYPSRGVVTEIYQTPVDLFFTYSYSPASFQIIASNCDNSKCGGHGVCYNDKCACFDFWTGESCEIKLCQYMNCGAHGTCVIQPNGYEQCVCDDGFAGDSCECPYAALLNKDTVKDFTPSVVGTFAFAVDAAEFINGFSVALTSAAPENFQIGNLRGCDVTYAYGFAWDYDRITSRRFCAPYPWQPRPSKDMWIVLVKNANIFNSFSLTLQDAGPVGTVLTDGVAMSQYVRNNDYNYGPGIRNYSIAVPRGQGVKIDVTIDDKHSASVYPLIKLYGSNYPCADRDGNYSIEAVGVTKVITLQTDCVTDGKFFVTLHNRYGSDVTYSIVARTQSGRVCTGPTRAPTVATATTIGATATTAKPSTSGTTGSAVSTGSATSSSSGPKPTKLVITLNADCSTLDMAQIKAKVEEIIKIAVTITNDCPARKRAVVRLTVTMANGATLPASQAQDVKAGLQAAGFDVQGIQVVDPAPDTQSSAAVSTTSNQQSPASSLSSFSSLFLILVSFLYVCMPCF